MGMSVFVCVCLIRFAFSSRLRKDAEGNKCILQKKIHFVHTSNETELPPISRCALESAVKFNPSMDVVVYSIGQRLQIDRSAGYRTVAISYEDVFKNTPLEPWYKGNSWQKGYAVINLSDALRLAILYKYGGVYFDLDVVSVAPLPQDGSCGGMGVQIDDPDNAWYINNAALMFPQGSEFLRTAMTDFVANFDGTAWGQQGPALMTRLWRAKKWTARSEDFRVFPKERFYPFSWDSSVTKPLWEDPVGELPAGSWTQPDSDKTSAVHLWNHATHDLKVHVNSAISNMLKSSCPGMVSSGALFEA
eukprot:TRINITY_DN12921_c0_g1_i3.p1 TRINITY_DN12921_c0_g1~~TRINITY_DN12921_c0_g1_i3.p1  ORF type:complete len:304 (-),score=25.40 TRINITY_DN12921_c0_g1_i3:73-984(-)